MTALGLAWLLGGAPWMEGEMRGERSSERTTEVKQRAHADRRPPSGLHPRPSPRSSLPCSRAGIPSDAGGRIPSTRDDRTRQVCRTARYRACLCCPALARVR